MQLTKLEIKGFKSFGDKIVINFDEGVTGVVGPNGCGKSNVVDAIRWVLGEQKISALRSEKMENIIFNGTRTRKPTQLAEVSLTFNNTKNLLPTEYHQVTITRRYYRSGDGEYLLNGVTCRLKDITNLFLDTGIASNSYAIIELKMVDDILNDKDNSRRQLFEEAAGISKFRVRKKETLKKLGETDADLERVEDLLFEIDKNMRSLERQAKQAERYFKLKEEYKKLSISLSIKRIAGHLVQEKMLKIQIDAENDRKVSLLKQIAEMEAGLSNQKTDILQREKLLSSRQKALNEHVGKIRQYESDKKIKNERLRYLTDKSDNLKDQIEQDKQSNERAAFSIKSLKQEKESAEKILAEIEMRLDQLVAEKEEQQRKTQSIHQDYSTLDQLFKNTRDNLYQTRKDIEIKEIQLSSFRQELEKNTSDATAQSASLAEFDTKINILREELALKDEHFRKLKGQEEKLKQQIEATEKTIEVIREEQVLTGRRLDARQNEYNLTKSLVDNLEGFPEAIKFLKKKANWNKNAPLLSDIITCDEKYRVTIENFLEPYMNYYIVDDSAEAYQAINLLSDASKGKAHFFILSTFDDYHVSKAHFYETAFPATEIIEYDSKYKKLVSHLLDGVYIVRGSEKEIPENASDVFITENSKVIRRKYSVSGGSVGLFEGKRIGRAKNLEKLLTEIRQLQKKSEEIKDNMKEKQQELESHKASVRKNDLESLQSEINQLHQDLISIETRSEQFNHMLSNSTNRREDILDKIAELNVDLENLRPLESQESAELQLKSEKLEAMKMELDGFTELLDIKKTAFNEENIRYHQQQNKVNSLTQEIGFKESAFEGSTERIQKNSSELQKCDDEIKKLLDSNEIKEDELVEMYHEKDRIESGLNEAEKEYYALRGEIDKTESQIRELQKSRENCDTLLMEIQNKLNDLKLQINSVKERLSVEFGVEMSSIEPDETEEDLPEEVLKENVDEVRQKIDRIGPINPMAMEAYNEISERYNFIQSQKADLVAAKESLLTTIGEIDLVAKETFLTAFHQIKDNFIRVFRSLFTHEDDCDLKLSDPANPLDSSIEIMAKPKGKRPLTINQLSGGEKTLTAISLLFSIYLLKPAPFCIFDEVDAPLDDANIDKFNAIIKKFSKDSQFIIVTHNKRTMAAVDIIYGITMIEQGVSRVVPVDFRELV
ncbi:MAG: chromosome segregation protein SMC [Cyclobacteriaceae bacterium]|nr:chromosome segregation protein SMC [Cyclobacteriaceae bacterium]